MPNAKEIVILGLVTIFAFIILTTHSAQIMGTIANATTNACKNCNSDTKALLPSINIFYIFLALVSLLGTAVVIYHARN